MIHRNLNHSIWISKSQFIPIRIFALFEIVTYMGSRRWPKFDRSSRNSKKIKKMWNLGTLPLFHTYYPFRLRNLSYNKWFTCLFTNMRIGVEGSLHVRQMRWIMTISKANIAQMASNLAHGCTMAWHVVWGDHEPYRVLVA